MTGATTRIGRASRVVTSDAYLHRGDARQSSIVNTPALSRDYTDADVLHQ